MKVAQAWIWKQCKYITKQHYMKVAHPGYEEQCIYITKQYYMKVAQPEYENNENTLLSNIIWK